MINVQYLTEKAALKKSAKSGLLLIELEGQKKVVKKAIKRQKLNLSLVIDVSGSMSDLIVNSEQLLKDHNFNQPSIFSDPFQARAMINNRILGSYGSSNYTNKMELVKKAAIKAVEELNDGDYVSLVTFNSNAYLIQEAQKVTKETKAALMLKISQLHANGGTNLHSGWVTGATEVVKNLKEKYINRVLLLTDGETVSGVTDPKEIAKDVAAIYKTGITTSTFGVGDRFNENLLQSMSEQGGGNFYYIKDEKEFTQMFMEEFTGMANIAGSEIELSIELKDGFKVQEQMNNFLLVDNVYKLANVLSGKKLSVLFKIETNIPNGLSRVDVGELVLKYKDENGNKIEQVMKIEVDVLSEKKWEKLDFNQEVKIQETLLTIAKNKLDASNAIAAGNIEGAKGILRGASAALSASGFADDRISASLNSLTTTLSNADTMNSREFSKAMHYESYKTRTGKDGL